MRFVSVKTFSFILFLYIMAGAHAWFMWPLDNPENFYIKIVLSLFLTLLCFLYIQSNNLKLSRAPHIIWGLLCLVFVYCMDRGGVRPMLLLDAFVFIMPLWCLLSLKGNCDTIIRNIVNWFAISMIPGILLHLYFLLGGAQFPGIPIVYPGNQYYYFYNYLFLLRGIDYYEKEGIRFLSYFLESGYLGTLISFLLYTIRFDLKKYKMAWILLVSLFLSLSLAGYILTFMGYLYLKSEQKNKISVLVATIIISFSIFQISKNYNNGKNILNEWILERLEFDENKGIAGNNRTGNGADSYFEKSLANGSALWGLGIDKINKINGGKGWQNESNYDTQIRGAGYKIFILRKGFIGCFFSLIAYCLIGVYGRRNKRYAIGYFIIVIITFLQASYPESYSWLIPYILGASDNCDDHYLIKNSKLYCKNLKVGLLS